MTNKNVIFLIVISMAFISCRRGYQAPVLPITKIAVIGPTVYGVQGVLDTGKGSIWRTGVVAGGQKSVGEAFEKALVQLRVDTEEAFSELYEVIPSEEFLEMPEVMALSEACLVKADCQKNSRGELLGSFGRNMGGVTSAALPKDKIIELANLLGVDGILVVSSQWRALGKFAKQAYVYTLARLYDRAGNNVYASGKEAYGGAVGGWRITVMNAKTMPKWAEAHRIATEGNLANFKKAKNL